MNIGKSIKIALIERDMKAKDLAAAIGVKPSYISGLATGAKAPTFRSVTAICHVLGYPVSEFIALGEEKAA